MLTNGATALLHFLCKGLKTMVGYKGAKKLRVFDIMLAIAMEKNL
jgi:hypothetical protein